MQNYTIILTKKQEVAEGTYKYIFAKPVGFSFSAGQYAMLEIIEPTVTDDRPSFRSLSLSSAPHEDHLAFIMRHSDSGFKQSLHALKEGEQVIMKGPLGHMQFPEDERKSVVFLAAGVGITPVRSMLLEAQHKNSKRELTLFYSNRQPSSAACLQEVTTFDIENYTCINTMTRSTDSWDGHVGKINARFLSEFIKDFQKPLFYVIGTTAFVNAMKEILKEKNVDKSNILIDNFG